VVLQAGNSGQSNFIEDAAVLICQRGAAEKHDRDYPARHVHNRVTA
jgi:hypothetical protein